MALMAYYNEIDKNACLWLQAAMDAGYIAKGDIDSRPIQEVTANDIRGYTQHHFFAGIGGWSIALRLAGWSDDTPVWTGSCPCQPFSTAGRQKGKGDDRHLWPHWFRLIRECQPATIFGEQVSNAITFGWLDDVANDMESEGYAFASAVLPACSVGAPHKRDRLWFVGDSDHQYQRPASQHQTRASNATRSGEICSVGDSHHDGQFTSPQPRGERTSVYNDTQRQNSAGQSKGAGDAINVAYASQQGLEEHGKSGQLYDTKGWEVQVGHPASSSVEWLLCPDGKARAVESSIPLLVNGIPKKLRKAALHGFGNAIVPQVAAKFIQAYMKLEKENA